jgi:hypothetical protein
MITMNRTQATIDRSRTLREAFAEMHRAVDNATAPLVPCQECGRNLPTTELTRSGHCSPLRPAHPHPRGGLAMNLPTKPPGLPTEAPITQLVTKLTDSQTLNAMIKAQRRRRTPRLRVINRPTPPTT